MKETSEGPVVSRQDDEEAADSEGEAHGDEEANDDEEADGEEDSHGEDEGDAEEEQVPANGQESDTEDEDVPSHKPRHMAAPTSPSSSPSPLENKTEPLLVPSPISNPIALPSAKLQNGNSMDIDESQDGVLAQESPVGSPVGSPPCSPLRLPPALFEEDTVMDDCVQDPADAVNSTQAPAESEEENENDEEEDPRPLKHQKTSKPTLPCPSHQSNSTQ